MAHQYDLVIIGAGMVGLMLAERLSRNDFSVAVIDTRQPLLQWQSDSLDARVCALSNDSVSLLKTAGVWHAISDCAKGRFEAMQVFDVNGGGELSFDAADMGWSELGYIVENRAIVKALWQRLADCANVKLLSPVTPVAFQQNAESVVVNLDNGVQLVAKCAVAADGARSWLRQQLGAPLKQKDYQQHAIVAVVKCDRSHQEIARQYFHSSGPLALLPLASPWHCAIVWSNDDARAHQLMSLGSESFEQALCLAAQQAPGTLELLTERQSIALTMRHADHYVQSRVAFVGDAAHTLHPLAGQGVNLGFQDVDCLAKTLALAQQQQRDVGQLRVLRQYERARRGDNALMIAAMSAFKEIFSLDFPLLVSLRSGGIAALNAFTGFKKMIMKQANRRGYDSIRR